jgi:hypothetical protein
MNHGNRTLNWEGSMTRCTATGAPTGTTSITKIRKLLGQNPAYPWRQEIGPVDNLTGAADKISNVLRADGR